MQESRLAAPPFDYGKRYSRWAPHSVARRVPSERERWLAAQTFAHLMSGAGAVPADEAE